MKNFLHKKTKERGFTLVEMLIAVGVFTLATVFATRIMIDVLHIDQKTDVLSGIYEDSRIIFQQLAKEIRGGTIDYEEYYNINVIQALQSPSPEVFNSSAQASVKMPAGGPYYGINYGAYSSRFFDPGKRLDNFPSTNPEDLGIECSLPENLPEGEECEVYYTYSSDFNTGQNPYKKGGSDPNSGDALCDKGIGKCGNDKNIVDELYLINSSGSKKTIIARRKMNADDWGIGRITMEGQDMDQNGFIDIFGCNKEFTCFQKDPSGNVKIFDIIKYPFIQLKGTADGQTFLEDNNVSLPRMSDRFEFFDVNTSHFIPISPKRSTVKSLKFIINPVEDPYKAYDEKSMQQHPTVTILLTLNLASEVAAEYPGKFNDFSFQTTVAVGVIGKMDAYPPVNDVLSTINNASWISEVLPGNVNK